MNIGDLFLGLKVDPSGELRSAVTKAAKEAGDAGGKQLGLSIGTALKGAAVLIAGGLAIATKGAAEAEAAQGKFMAATGASREEAKLFVSAMDGLAGSSGTVGKSFADIAETGTEVARQFKLTGQEGAALTEKFLEFAKVTGQDATGAVGDFDAVLDAFKLPASAAKGLMDQLVASNQKFGTDAGPAATDALLKMAPALQGLNLGLDEGVGLLNLFEDNGLNADAAMRGLQTAVKNIKPGQTFDDLIARVSSIEDPTLRAQEAMKLFGTKAGSGLALALRPGVTSLDGWKISAKEAGDATTTASENMLTFSDRIQGWVQKGLAGLREVGQEFGPLVTALGSMGTLFGPAISKSLVAGWGLAAKSQAVQAAVQAAGIAMTSDLALGLGTGGGLALIGKFGSDFLGNVADAIGGSVGTAFHPWRLLGQQAGEATATGIPQGLAAGIAAERSEFGVGQILGPYLDPSVIEAGTAAGTAGGQAIAEGIAQTAPESGTAMKALLDAMRGRIADSIQTFNESARGIGNNLADALRGTKDSVKSAIDDLMYVINHPLKAEKEIARIEGALTSQNLADALASKNKSIHDTAEQTRARLEALWTSLTGTAYTAGTDASSSLKDGLNDSYPGAVADAKGVVGDINGAFEKLKLGYTIKVSAQTGFTVGQTPIEHRASGGRVTAGHLYRVNEIDTEYFRPDVNGTVLTHNQNNGGTSNVTINVYDATDPEKVGNVVLEKLKGVFRTANSLSLDTSGRPI